MKSEKATAGYRVITGEDGNRYRFYCDRSGALGCETSVIHAAKPDEELHIAWQTEGRRYFNRCKRCGSWVIDTMYNADVLECVDCTPWEEEPRYCSQCGTKIQGDEVKCKACGASLRYGGEES